jgi:hypothetical protein
LVISFALFSSIVKKTTMTDVKQKQKVFLLFE